MTRSRIADAGRLLCLLGAALGATGLIGWLADMPSLTTIFPGQPTMKPNTALSLILLGLGAALRRRRGASRALRMVSILAALAVLAAGIMTLTEYALNIDLHIDRLVASEPMSPPIAVALCLLAS